MGDDYSDEDWQADISFMLQCLQFYLSLPKNERRLLPPMQRIEQREMQASIGKTFQQWADEFFSTNSGHLDCELKAEDVIADFNKETHGNWSPKRVTDHLKEYCQFAEHIACYNPASVTGQKKDGERWRTRDSSGKQHSTYYIQSVNANKPTTTQLQLGLDPDEPF